MSQDDTIPLHSQRPRSSDHFRASAQGWYNPVMFSRTEVTRSIMDRCPRMIQSLFILEDRGLRITLGKVPKDDTIPSHSRWPRSPDLLWTDVPGWYNPSATSLLPLSRKVFPNNTKLVLKVFKLYSRQRLRWYIIIQAIIIYVFNIQIYRHVFL